MGDAAIAVHGLRKSYGEHEVIRGISFEVSGGEVLGFLGPNGAGKSTTIEILEGFRPRTGGDVTVLGFDPAKRPRELRARMGLVLQDSELDPNLSVRETIAMFAGLYPSPRAVGEVIELVGLDGREDSLVGTLSGGQRRRADVAVGIVGDPDVVFLDEPTTGFDPSARREAWSMIEGLKQLGKTVFLTTHYMDEAQHLADRVIILRDGRIIASGSPDELEGGAGHETVVTFRVPDGADARSLSEVAGERVRVDGAQATIATADAQRTLFRLTSWADQAGATLEGLQARRPSLEDVFLELTSEGSRAEG